jgi:hypothetical protein
MTIDIYENLQQTIDELETVKMWYNSIHDVDGKVEKDKNIESDLGTVKRYAKKLYDSMAKYYEAFDNSNKVSKKTIKNVEYKTVDFSELNKK